MLYHYLTVFIVFCSGERVSFLLADWQRHQRSADDEPERSLQSHQQTFWPVQEAGGAEGGEQEELHGEGGDVVNILSSSNNHRVTPIRCSLRNRWHRREVSGTRDRASRVSRRTASPCSRRTTPPRTGWTCCPSAGPLPSTAPQRGCISLISTSRSQVDFFLDLPRKDGLFHLLLGRLVFETGVGVKVAAGCNQMQITCPLIRRDCPRNFIPHNVLRNFMLPNVTWNNKKAIILERCKKVAITWRAWDE